MSSPEIMSALAQWRRVNDKLRCVEVQILRLAQHPDSTDEQVLAGHKLYRQMMAETNTMQERLRKKWPNVTTRDGRRSIWDREFL